MGKRTEEYRMSKVNSIIGKGTEYEGTIRTKETFRVDGRVIGTINSEGTIIVGNGGYVDGVINTVNVLIGGEVHGAINASGRIEVNPGGKVFGEIYTQHLIVDDRGIFQGTCVMLDDLKASKEAEKKNEEPGAPVQEAE